MKKEKVIRIQEFKKGMYFRWAISTKTRARITVRLKDLKENELYVEASSKPNNKNDDYFQALGQGRKKIKGDDFGIVIIAEAVNDKEEYPLPPVQVIEGGANEILVEKEKITLITCSKTILGEDYTDKSHDDICIQLIAWVTR